jgi:hypothetical protein
LSFGFPLNSIKFFIFFLVYACASIYYFIVWIVVRFVFDFISMVIIPFCSFVRFHSWIHWSCSLSYFRLHSCRHSDCCYYWSCLLIHFRFRSCLALTLSECKCVVASASLWT